MEVIVIINPTGKETSPKPTKIFAYIDEIENNCPYCNHSEITALGTHWCNNFIYVSFICNDKKCSKVFSAVIKSKETSEYNKADIRFLEEELYSEKYVDEVIDQWFYFCRGAYKVKKYLPENVMSLPIEYKSDFFSRISPDFIKIYNQSEIALSYKLNEVAGPGYRKALEYLVKDYAINHNPGKITEIEEKSLGECILRYLTLSEKGKELLRRASWLGNDEVHYKRKWVDKDIEDLRKVIQLVLTFIKTDHETQELIDSMPDDK